MNPLFIKSHLLVFTVLLVVSQSIAQVKPQQNQGSQDSVQYVVPIQSNADLSLLTPPAGFEVSPAFNGYISYPNSSAILMIMLENVNYLQTTKGMDDDFYRANNFTYVSSFDLLSDHGVKGKVYKLSFFINTEEFVRYMVFAGDLEKTLWLNITYPKLLEELLEVELLKTLQTIHLNPTIDEK